MKLLYSSLILLWFNISFSQNKLTTAQVVNLEWWSMCEYDYDFQKCLTSAQIHTNMLVKLEEGGTGMFHMLGDDGNKSSFTITGAWGYTNYTLFALRNQKGTELTLIFFFKDGYYTQCSLKANALQSGLVFY